MTISMEQEKVKVIIFQMDEKEYAVDVQFIQSIERFQPITRVPNTPSFVKGVINLRGVVTPIVDLREKFGIESKEMDDSTRMIMVTFEDYDVGLIVDLANDVIDLPVEAIESQPEVVGTVESEFISGVAKIDKRLLVLLDLEKVLEPIKRGKMNDSAL